MTERSEIFERVTKAIYDNMDVADGLDSTAAAHYAQAAIEAMRDLVKCTPRGATVDDILFNRYIDVALGKSNELIFDDRAAVLGEIEKCLT